MKFVCPSLDVTTMQKYIFCSICPQSRQTRLPFRSSFIKTTSPFEILHVDVWGPYSSPTYDGCTYFLTVVDDSTRCTWVFLMKYKSQSLTFLQQLSNYIENQFHTTIKVVRTNHARELCDGNNLRWYIAKGITHQTNCVDTP